MKKVLQSPIGRNDFPLTSDHFNPLPWPAQRIRERHGLTTAAALVTAREAGFCMNRGR